MTEPTSYNAPLATAPAASYSTVLCVTPEQLERAMAIRYKVFVEEQGYDAAIEVDSMDPLCDHLLMCRKNEDGTEEDVGTLRWCVLSNTLAFPARGRPKPAFRFPPRSKLGRVAIVKQLRGTGAGRILCEALEEHVRERRGRAADVTRGKSSLELLAYSQKTAEGFYAKMGWHSIGPDFLEEGQPHVKMVKRIELVPEPKIAVLNGSSAPIRTYNVRFVENEQDFDRVIKVRIAVFVEEQGYSLEDELDEKDPESDHFLMTTVGPDGNEEDAGTIRWWPKPNQAAGKMGRVAVLPKFRGGGTGRLLIQAMEEHVRQRKGKAGVAAKGYSTMHAEGFYAKAGYLRQGEQFMEDGAPHCLLIKDLELDAI
ncbi:GNAT family acetyltransferase [Rhodotorula taiwanensis]|uniref:GNAT family acetyltransferase n=1 Tax=Rhodotorula taiwanensis TaxID=741276 RepID=A0A2S5BF17_9BASI|nr:GNAT family acetyltransferase [Rhodotorula taiwanensis]